MSSNPLRMQFKNTTPFSLRKKYREHIFNNTKAYASMSSNLGQFCNFPDMFLYAIIVQASSFSYTRIFQVNYKNVTLKKNKKANMIYQKQLRKHAGVQKQQAE